MNCSGGAPKVFPGLLLMTALSLLAAGQDQTSTAPIAVQGVNGKDTVVQGINAEDGDPKPCKAEGRTDLDVVPDSAHKPTPQTTAKRTQPRIGAAVAGIPAVPVNPPKIIFPPGQPEPINLRDIYWENLFISIGFYNRWAEEADKADKHEEAASWRTSHQRQFKLNDAEGEILQEIAHDCNCAIKEQDAKLRAEGEKFRAQIVPGATLTVPPESYQLFEGRKMIIRDHVEQLRAALGDTSFKKVETHVLSMYGGPKKVDKPKPPATTSTGKSQQENRSPASPDEE